MSQSWLFGVAASGPLVLGALAGTRLRLPKRVLAAMLSFAAGALIAAVAYELFADSFDKGGPWRAGLGMFVGATVFTTLSAMLDRWATGGAIAEEDDGSAKLDKDAASGEPSPTPAPVASAAGLALLAAVTLDGVPENVALGVSLSEGMGGLALLAAIFVSNLPEVGSASMREQGHSDAFIVGTWTGAAVLLTLAVVLGAGPLALVSAETISLPLAFAAGAVLASLADTVMPEAYEQGGPLVALSTTAGFVLAFMLATV